MWRRRLSDWISLGVLASWVDRDAVDDAVEAAGKAARRKGGKLPPQVMVYFVMALALFADEDYEEVWARLAETLADWGGFGDDQALVTTGGITQARQRLGRGAGAGDVHAGRGTGRDAGHGGGVPRDLAQDEHRRPGMGRPGHGGQRGRVRLPGHRKAAAGRRFPRSGS